MTSIEKSASLPKERLKCGVVMPISTIGECNESHWHDVRSIIYAAIEDAGFEPNLVSNADDIGVIQKRIVQNLYDNPIVVCDVSAKNPNVMFELGMRLAFDKPTVIVKDDQTSYSFDTSPIEHLTYPRDLRFTRITEFKLELTNKVQLTAKAALSDSNYSTFLKHFGKFSVAKLDSTEVSGDQFIIEELRELRSYIRDLGIGRRISKTRDAKAIAFETRMLDSISGFRKELKLDSFSQLETQRNELRSRIESYAPDYFDSQTEYHQAFDRLWDTIFG